MASYFITKKQYDYLLPIYGLAGSNKMLTRTNSICTTYFFFGSSEEYKEMLTRCKYLN